MASTSARLDDTRWEGHPAITLRAGATSATFVPGLGMTGVSLRVDRREFLATPGGANALRGGHTLGLPLLAPWANRLDAGQYRVAGVVVDLRRRRLHRDSNGLPIHGLLVGSDRWRVVRRGARSGVVELRAAIAGDAAAFPFPHRIDVVARLRDRRLDLVTTVAPTTRRRVPIAFGWHPYLRIPGARRGQWLLRLPAREHLVLDARGLPTGGRVREPAERARIERRTFDDLYALGRDRALSLESDHGAVTVRGDAGYPYAQVWVPPGMPFAALEPMTAPTNALVTGAVPLVTPGD